MCIRDRVRGRWGGPPAGHNAPGTEPATDLAFAPRGELNLAAVLRQDIPEIALTAAAAVQPTSSGGAGGGGVPTTTRSGSGCGCGVVGTSPAPLLGLAVFGLALLWRRRTRS